MKKTDNLPQRKAQLLALAAKAADQQAETTKEVARLAKLQLKHDRKALKQAKHAAKQARENAKAAHKAWKAAVEKSDAKSGH
jgi:hypothetical protein